VSAAEPLVLRPRDGARLRESTRASSAAAGNAQRAQMALLASAGLSNAEIGRRVGGTRRTVPAWRVRYLARGVEALVDLSRSGRPATVDEAAVIIATLNASGDPS
jgi:transposase